MIKVIKIFIASFICVTGFSQTEIPTDYFSSPLDITLELSGTFGELRNNHFHSGLDIRTQQREGLPVYAAADGYVNRIKIDHFGYGKALYIQHPNGYSTVYAHLREYAGPIQEFVKNIQYKTESYEMESFPQAADLPVKKGELIGYSGNSGGSGAPHLHYEIRDNASRPMNPKLFGVDIPDTKKPLINSVFVYPSGDNSHVNRDANPVQLRLIPQKDGNYITEKISAGGTLGFGISAVDQQDAATNRNGVYKMETYYNGEKSLRIEFDRFSFAETRYLNRFIDYNYLKSKRSTIQKLFIERNNPLSIFKESVQNGFVSIEDGFDSIYTIEVSDFNDNKVIVSIPITGKDLPILQKKNEKQTPHYINSRESTTINEGKFTIFIPQNSLYEDAYLDIKATGDVLKFHNDVVPIHSNITITVDASNFKEADLDKVYIGRLNYRGQPFHNTTTREGTNLSAKVRTFGDYKLAVDTAPPLVTPLNFTNGRWISQNKTLEIKIEDHLSGIKSYRASINGKFILMEYDYKKNVLVYNFEDNITPDTENNLKLIVTDNVGNSTKFEATFFRK